MNCSIRVDLTALLESGHTVVCRVAQEAGMPHHEYNDKKKENVIFTPL